MSSIMTNSAAMTALKALQATNKAIYKTQERISTGYQVAQASDNAAYWSIATTMKSDNKALGTVQDALGLGASKVDVAYTALNSAIDVVDEIKAKIVAAKEPGIDRSKIQSEISELQNQLSSIATSASFSGENWLSVDSSDAAYTATKNVVASFTRASDGSVSVETLSIDITTTELFDANDQSGILDSTFTTGGAGAVTVSVSDLDITATNVDDTDLDDMLSAVDAAFGLMTDAASALGATSKRIDTQSEFVDTLMDAIERGVGQLVDADMEEESTRLQALQTQQQLGIQALSIANTSAQNILSLFQ
ncbi:flagellin [Oricola sp.]|uniref:flagellin N-terminal helical domain-containing protein n=1 Tax=Oricola sp. TaxID=1979950 RepID=UPI000C8C628C|nr:flagellin [Ahrensia sp.]|tara:strand:+ start:16275 stop:17195 length:921 start_codon:yes stop_codon:yes gene_type:complete